MSWGGAKGVIGKGRKRQKRAEYNKWDGCLILKPVPRIKLTFFFHKAHYLGTLPSITTV